jgi:chaperonin cofactor prefoldin
MGKRNITLLLRNATDELKDKIKSWCAENKIEISFESDNPYKGLYYFSILGQTQDYENLQQSVGNILTETYYAELGNIMDCPEADLKEFQEIKNECDRITTAESKVHTRLCNLIIKYNRLDVLKEMNRYSLTKTCKYTLEDQIDHVKGEPDSFMRALNLANRKYSANTLEDCLEIVREEMGEDFAARLSSIVEQKG